MRNSDDLEFGNEEQTGTGPAPRNLATFGLALLALLGTQVAAPARPAAPVQPDRAASAVRDAVAAGRDWIVDKADNICGLRSPDQLSNPVLVQFDELLDATPEMKELKDEGIGRDTAACEKVRSANSYCSVWKTVRHKDGRQITDVTAKVKALL